MPPTPPWNWWISSFFSRTSFVRSPRENWRTATPRTMTPATRTVKNGSGKSPAWPTVFRTSSSEILVSASWMVLNIRGRWEVTISCNDMSRLVEGRHLLCKMELGTKDRTLQIDKTANATRTRTQVRIVVGLSFTSRKYLSPSFLGTESRD